MGQSRVRARLGDRVTVAGRGVVGLGQDLGLGFQLEDRLSWGKSWG